MHQTEFTQFGSARRKLGNARAHVSKVRELIEPLEHQDNFPLEPLDLGHIGTVHRFRLRSVPDVPELLPLMVGDALTNLRASLDHAYWRARELRGGKLTTGTKFPLRSSEDQPTASYEPDVLLRDLVTRVQPWRESAPLWWQPHALNALVNVDKHHDVLTTLVIPDHSWWGSPPGVTMTGTATFQTPVAPATFELSFQTIEETAISSFDVHLRGTVGFSRRLRSDPSFLACTAALPEYLFQASIADVLDSFVSFGEATLDLFEGALPAES